MRKAVTHAFDAGSEFVEPSHLRLALQDDEPIASAGHLDVTDEPLSVNFERKRARDVRAVMSGGSGIPPRDSQLKEAPYQSLLIHTPDGKDSKWLDQGSYDVFLEGARRVRFGAYLPKHLAKALSLV
ncbi:MAG: hypothetical protein ABSE64_00700 [Vulcanimicrobiaceae bacterium]